MFYRSPKDLEIIISNIKNKNKLNYTDYNITVNNNKWKYYIKNEDVEKIKKLLRKYNINLNNISDLNIIVLMYKLLQYNKDIIKYVHEIPGNFTKFVNIINEEYYNTYNNYII
jgi:hypothetical protein